MMVAPQPSRKGENAVQDSQQRELMKQLDQLSEQIREHEHEETRAKIDELFQRVKAPGQNDNGAWIMSA
jgi:predicted ATPase